LPYVARILIPAAFGSILTGLKIGSALRGGPLIAAELVFGVSWGQGGLGWFIFENRNLFGYSGRVRRAADRNRDRLVVENLIFHTIERNTVQKWGTTIMIAKSVGWVERLAKPITTSRTAMGIASLNPSYEVVPT